MRRPRSDLDGPIGYELKYPYVDRSNDGGIRSGCPKYVGVGTRMHGEDDWRGLS